MDPNALLTKARVQFQADFLQSLEKIMPEALEALYRQADAATTLAEQGRYLHAYTLLRKSPVLQKKLEEQIDSLLSRSFQTTYHHYRPEGVRKLSSEHLQLQQEDALEGELLVKSMADSYRNVAGHEIRDLNIRIAILLAQDKINERENPFRPYLLARGIVNAVDDLRLENDVHQHLCMALVAYTQASATGMYARLNSLFAEAGIAAELQLKPVRNALPDADLASGLAQASNPGNPAHPASPRMPNHPAQMAGNEAAGGDFAYIGGRLHDLSQRSVSSDHTPNFFEQILSSLRNFASGVGKSTQARGVAPTSTALGTGFAQTAWLPSGQAPGMALHQFFENATPAPTAAVNPHILASIQHLHDSHRDASLYDAQGGIRNLILEQRSRLNDESSSNSEQMTIDVVAMLFEFILSDQQVPAEIRAQLGRLQFLILKASLRDPSLLTKPSHPARLLINRIASVSLGMQQIDPSGEKIAQEITRIVNALIAQEDTPKFAQLLDEFDAFVARELRSSTTQVEQTVAAIEQVQQHALRQLHISAELHEPLQKLNIPSSLQDFLENVWIRAIEQAERINPKQAQRFRLMVPDLLWSLTPKVREDDRTQLFALLPLILNTLREGLHEITHPAAMQQKLFDELVEIHTQALRATPNKIEMHAWSLPEYHEHFHDFLAPGANINPPRDLSGIQKILAQVILELDLKTEMLDQTLVAELPIEPETIDNENEFAEVRARLRSGVSLEIFLGAKPSLGRLHWVDAGMNNLVLKFANQEHPSVIGVRTLRRMITHGRVRFLETEPLFERAVQALLASADQIKLPSAVASQAIADAAPVLH